MYEFRIKTVIEDENNSPEHIKEVLTRIALPYLKDKLKDFNFGEIKIMAVFPSMIEDINGLGNLSEIEEDKLINNKEWMVVFEIEFNCPYTQKEIINTIENLRNTILNESGLLFESLQEI